MLGMIPTFFWLNISYLVPWWSKIEGGFVFGAPEQILVPRIVLIPLNLLHWHTALCCEKKHAAIDGWHLTTVVWSKTSVDLILCWSNILSFRGPELWTYSVVENRGCRYEKSHQVTSILCYFSMFTIVDCHESAYSHTQGEREEAQE